MEESPADPFILDAVRSQIHQLYSIVEQSERKAKTQWKEDKTVLEAYIQALSETKKVLKVSESAAKLRLDETELDIRQGQSKLRKIPERSYINFYFFIKKCFSYSKLRRK